MEWKTPFLQNQVLSNVAAVEVKGIHFSAAELLEYQRSIEGMLVVNPGLNNALETGYNKFLVTHGRPPDAVQNRKFPEYHFIPRKWPVTISAPSGLHFVPTASEVLLFFAVSRKF